MMPTPGTLPHRADQIVEFNKTEPETMRGADIRQEGLFSYVSTESGDNRGQTTDSQ
jgi:hypothetical protein